MYAFEAPDSGRGSTTPGCALPAVVCRRLWDTVVGIHRPGSKGPKDRRSRIAAPVSISWTAAHRGGANEDLSILVKAGHWWEGFAGRLGDLDAAAPIRDDLRRDVNCKELSVVLDVLIDLGLHLEL